MSRGPGTPSRDLTSVVLCSSRIISMQSSTHSSQMKTVGPAMSFLTSCWLLPQKEQYSSFSPAFFSLIQASFFGLSAIAEHIIHQAVFHCFVSRHEIIPVGVARDGFHALA